MVRHREIGAELHRMREVLVHLTTELGNAYPVNGRQYIDPCKALRAIDTMRSNLEKRMFQEHSGEATLDIYYPGNRGLER
mgnify:CR=1 FL=1